MLGECAMQIYVYCIFVYIYWSVYVHVRMGGCWVIGCVNVHV